MALAGNGNSADVPYRRQLVDAPIPILVTMPPMSSISSSPRASQWILTCRGKPLRDPETGRTICQQITKKRFRFEDCRLVRTDDLSNALVVIFLLFASTLEKV